MKILIIEDDRDIADFLKMGFESEGFTTKIEFDGARASYEARINIYDLIIMDYSLPSRNGLDICVDIRKEGLDVPIIFLSVMGDSKTKVAALEAGADDYMEKPFSFLELLARVQAVLRRPKNIESPMMKVGELLIDRKTQIVTRNRVPIYLTRKEYTLLEYFMSNPGAILSRGMIMEHVWNSDSDPFSNTVEAHILNLRRKINVGDQPEMIRNIPGRGYMLEGAPRNVA